MNNNADILKAAALFIDNKGRLLISKDKGATKWTILGGRVERDETHVECLQREIKEELDVEIEVNPQMYREAPAFPAANDPGKTVKHFYYFCKLLGAPKFIENVELLHWISKEDIESGNFEFSDATSKFLLPHLTKDNLLL